MQSHVKDILKSRAYRAAVARPYVQRLLGDGLSLREVAAALGVSKGAIENLLAGRTPQADTIARIEEKMGELEVWDSGDTTVRTEEVHLPDISFLEPGARTVFQDTIWNWMTEKRWTLETVEKAATLLLGYFKRTSTLQSSGASQPQLSEEMQILVLRESREEIENAYAHLAGGSKS